MATNIKPTFFEPIRTNDDKGLRQVIGRQTDNYLSWKGRRLTWVKSERIWKETTKKPSRTLLTFKVLTGLATFGVLPIIALGIKTAYRHQINDRIKKWESVSDAEVQMVEKAADNNDTNTILELGDKYRLELDPVKAKEFYIKAAENGNAQAMYNLLMMFKKRGDFEQANEWAVKAAEKDHLDAMTYLAETHLIGRGVKRDSKQAIELYEQAAAKGSAHAMHALSCIYDSGCYVKVDLDKANEWAEKAAKKDHEDAIAFLSTTYLKDKNTVPDSKQAIELYEQAVKENGNAQGMRSLASIFKEGYLIEKDLHKAKEWEERAIKKDHDAAMSNLRSDLSKKMRDPISKIFLHSRTQN